MKRLIALVVVSTLVGAGCVVSAAEPLDPREKDRRSYSIGYQVGSDFNGQDVEIRSESLLKGIEDAVNGHKPALSEAEMRSALRDLQMMVSAQRQQKMDRAAAENRKAGAAFLAENGKKEGVVTLPSGLQYLVIRPGDGLAPGPKDTVSIHYRGRLIDGSEFENSISRGGRLTVPVGGVIPGWTEALQLMKPGAKWRLFIPPELAYGKTGSGNKIGPNATLIFDVELVEIKSAPKNAGND